MHHTGGVIAGVIGLDTVILAGGDGVPSSILVPECGPLWVVIVGLMNFVDFRVVTLYLRNVCPHLKVLVMPS